MVADLGCGLVSRAATVAQALAVIETHVFDAVMLDMNLKCQKTYSVTDVLAARGVQFLFTTGYDENTQREGYRDHPMLRKPFHSHDLAAASGRMLPVSL